MILGNILGTNQIAGEIKGLKETLLNESGKEVGEKSANDGFIKQIKNTLPEAVEAFKVSIQGLFSQGLNGFQILTKSSGAFIKTLWSGLSVTSKFAIGIGAIVGLVAIFDALNVSIDEAHESLEKSMDAFEESTEKLKSLEDEFKNVNKQITELQKLADAGTISIADQEQLELLQKTNKELERKIALEQAEQIRKGKQALKDAKKVSDTKVKSQYKHKVSTGDTQSQSLNYQNVSVDEELGYAIDAYQYYSELLENNNLDDRTRSIYESGLKNAENRIAEMQTVVSSTVTAYNELIDAGMELDAEQQEEYNSLRKVQDAYLLFTYDLNKTKEAFNGLNTEQQKTILLNRLLEKGLTQEEANVIVKSLSPSDYGDAWESDFNFTPPELTDYDSSEEYGKAYVQAWLKGARQEAEDKSVIIKTNIQVLSSVESLSKGLDQLGEIYKDVLDGKDFDYSSILNNEDFKETFGDYNEEYDKFIETIANSPNDIDACQDAFNKLATAYIYDKAALEDVTEETKDATVAMLKQMGISNALEVVESQLAINTANLADAQENLNELKEKGIDTSVDLENATAAEIISLIDESKQAGFNTEALQNYLLKKIQANEIAISTNGDIQNLADLCGRLGIAGEALKTYARLKERTLGAPYASGQNKPSVPTLGVSNLALNDPTVFINEVNNKIQEAKDNQAEIDALEAELQKALVDFANGNFNISGNFNGGSATNSLKDSAQTYDWIETLISRIQRSITKLGKTVSATYKSWTDRNKALKTSISEIANEYNKQNEAATYYRNKANSVGLDETYAKKVREGDMSVQEGVTDEALKEKIEKYREYWEKYLGAEDAAIDAQSELVAKYQEQFDLITGEFDAKMGVLEHQANMINGYIDQAEAKGHFTSEKYYDKLIALEKGNMAYLEEQRDKLQSSFDEMMASGDVAMYSQQWYEMSAQILEVDEAIQECNASITESENKINELRWAVFDKAQEMISEIHDEKEFLLQLIEEDDLFDDNGNWTEYADAKAGLHAADYNTYMAQANDYANAIKELDETYEDKNSQIYLDRKKELIAAQREMILAAQDEKQAMIDLASNGYDAMLEALNELIEKEKEAMDEFKSLYDYQNSISEKTKNINSLEKKLDAYKGDDSEEAQSVIQQTTVQLEEARKDLEQTEMDKNIEDRKQLLDKLADDTQEWVDTRLDDTNGLLEDILNSVNGDTDSIKATLEGLAEGVGTSLSTEMSAIFGEGSLVSTVSQTLTDIKGFVEKLVTDADKKADENIKDTEDKDDKQPSGTGSGTGNAGGNTGSGQKPTTSSTPTISKNEDTSKKKWGWWFVPQNWNGNNKLLNTETSIEDRLRSLDYAFDMANRAKYFEAMGLGKASNYRGTYEQNVAMLKEMKKHKGFKVGSRRIPKNQNAWTQENGQELIYRSSDGAILTPLGRGDAVFTADMTQRLWDIAKTPDIFSHLTTTTLPKGIVSSGMNNNVQNDVVMNISLPNVVDVDGFVNELKTNKRFEKVVQSMTIGAINPKGSNSLSKMKF